MNPKKLIVPEHSITEEDWKVAEKDYQPNCGPCALAIMTGCLLTEVLPLIPHFKERHYTNPTMMASALRSMGVLFHERDDSDCEGHTLTRYGLVRIQFVGPWNLPGQNPKWAYRHSHWIGAAEFGCWGGIKDFVFDINGGWELREDWESGTLPNLIKHHCDKRATGEWYATHRWELFDE